MHATCEAGRWMLCFHNRFWLECSDGKRHRVRNMWAENFDRLREGGLKYPIEVTLLDDGQVDITDARIKPKWFITE